MMNMTTYLCIDYRYLKNILVWEVNHMPTWFQNKIQKAFYEKDRYQIKLLNQCWFFYKRKHI
jgi:hypothetical protein